MRISKLKNTLTFRDMSGFTLVEILVSLVIVGFLMSAVYAVQVATTRAVKVEEERVEIQQDQRIAFGFMASELRLAGYDKTETLIPAIVDARSNFIYFTVDRNDDGDVDDDREHIAFCLYNSQIYGRSLSYISGQVNTVGQVGSAVGGGAIPIGHTHPPHQHEVFALVDELEFYYTLVDGTQTTDPGVGQMDDIRSVEITLLSRADTPDPRWIDSLLYTSASGVVLNPGGVAYDDTTRRRLLTATIRFRNMGLD